VHRFVYFVRGDSWTYQAASVSQGSGSQITCRPHLLNGLRAYYYTHHFALILVLDKLSSMFS
jgi:hypothetical protein